MNENGEGYRAAAYCRLSRDDGDRAESDSIVNQQRVIEDFCAGTPELEIADRYVDDGWTGTNFDRPDFRRMIADIERGSVNCVIVKDLSRFGRDYIDMGFYLERFFPAKKVRFIAVNDGVDSARGAYDMLLPLKNIFNAQYARDISDKVRSAFRVKQRQGEFCGAFAAYGYLKDPADRNHLIVDPVAAETVNRMFEWAARGMGKRKIADVLNAGGVPSPGEYKRLMGMKYRNTGQETQSRGWTYAAVDRVLRNEIYLGNMVSNRSSRAAMHGRETANAREQWIIVEGTHDAVVSRELWDTVRRQLGRYARSSAADGSAELFAGFLRCGDCGSSLTKTTWNRRSVYCCGAYQRYGTAACTKHYIFEEKIAEIVLQDINRVICRARGIRALAGQSGGLSPAGSRGEDERKRLEAAIERASALRKGVYEDYRDGLLSRDEYLRYREDYAAREKTLVRQLEAAESRKTPPAPAEQPWVRRLIRQRALERLDRTAVAQNIQEICVFEGNRLKITYLLSPELGAVMAGRASPQDA